MPTARSRLVVALDETTYDKFRDLAASRGVTISALIEAIGRGIDPDDPSPALVQAISDAHRIQAERNDRRRRST